MLPALVGSGTFDGVRFNGAFVTDKIQWYNVLSKGNIKIVL